MAFKYINPGYVSLLDSGASEPTQIADKRRSKTGVAFTQINSNVGITLPDFKEGDEFWGKFDFFVPPPTSIIYINLYIPGTYDSGFYFSYPTSGNGTISLIQRANGSAPTMASGSFATIGFEWNAINTITFHAILGNSSTAKLEVFIGDNKFVSTGYGMPYLASYSKKARLYSDKYAVFFSNIIFSNEEISPKEQIITLPISQTITDMTVGEDGIFIADTANQSLLQSVDVTQLIENYGASSAITGIALVGNPAYKTREGLANLTALSKAGASITEYNTHNLSNDTSGGIVDSRAIENMTIADLQNMQFGWKVGE